jgi:muramoyltetrapeptide carboxypeptidase
MWRIRQKSSKPRYIKKLDTFALCKVGRCRNYLYFRCMERKKFIGSLLASAGLPLLGFGQTAGYDEAAFVQPGYHGGSRIPPYLKPGDTIGITCPAGFIVAEDIAPAVQQLEAWGLRVAIGDTVGKKDLTFGGTDAERAADFQRMLDDAQVKAILCARGGYGMARMVDRLDFKKFLAQPKWVIGFSDVTVVHCHLANLGMASLHSKMCNSFPKDWAQAEPIQIETILSIKKALMGEKMLYTAPANPNNRPGTAVGELIGGNLKIWESLGGTPSDCSTDGKLLFLEDTGEYLYSIDRMFWNLKRRGKLKKLKGLIIGGFKTKAEEPGEEFGRSLYDIVREVVKEYAYPVCFDFPVGHQRNNFALKCGARHRLEVGAEGVRLEEG